MKGNAKKINVSDLNDIFDDEKAFILINIGL